MYDAIVVGGGPAGSVVATKLVAGGLRVAVVDRAEFPRVKLCAGWLSPPFWDAIGRSPSEYPRGLWEWHRCHVHYKGKPYSVPGHGWFIRRFELDDWLLRGSGAELHLGTNVKDIAREGDAWRVGELRGKILIGAGGTHCPVARMLAPERPRRAVGVQELELQADPQAIARTRIGDDGEPELLLFDDLSGYGWNVPKSDWLNVGCGTLDATIVRDAWHRTREKLSVHMPVTRELDHVKGHSYFLFDPVHIASAAKNGTYLAGDALGLAHPLTAEGIVPAVTSAKHLAESILDGTPASYPDRLRTDPLLADYRRVHALIERARALRSRMQSKEPKKPKKPSQLGSRAVARGFAWMFSGARLPAPRLLDLVIGKDRSHGRHV